MVRYDPGSQCIQQRIGTMRHCDRELSLAELDAATGGGIVDNVVSDAEAATDAFLKRFADSSQRFIAFLNTPVTPTSATGQE